MLSGDAHMLAFDDGRNNAHGGFVVAQAAPLDRFVRRKGGPYSHDPPDQRNGQFGVAAGDRRRPDAHRHESKAIATTAAGAVEPGAGHRA